MHKIIMHQNKVRYVSVICPDSEFRSGRKNIGACATVHIVLPYMPLHVN